MRCPYCNWKDSKVLDSRAIEDGAGIRRRRECPGCRRRFTTFERLDRTAPAVIKRDGRREAFDRTKILTGMQRACEGRPVALETLEQAVEEIERGLQERGVAGVASREIGDQVIERLRRMDDVAYLRFASVYRRVEDVDRLVEEIERLKARKQREAELATQIVLIPAASQGTGQSSGQN